MPGRRIVESVVMSRTFTRDGDRCLIDGVEVSKTEWEAQFAEVRKEDEAADDADEEHDWARTKIPKPGSNRRTQLVVSDGFEWIWLCNPCDRGCS